MLALQISKCDKKLFEDGGNSTLLLLFFTFFTVKDSLTKRYLSLFVDA